MIAAADIVDTKTTPFSNLLLTLLQTLDVPAESFSDSTGTLDLTRMA